MSSFGNGNDYMWESGEGAKIKTLKMITCGGGPREKATRNKLESSQRWKRTKRKLCPTTHKRKHVKKGGEVITFKTLSKMTKKCSLN